MVVVVIVVLIAHLYFTATNITTPISDIKDNQAPPPLLLLQEENH